MRLRRRLGAPHAGALPHASFIGPTGTPIELQKTNLRLGFVDCIVVYEIQCAVQDSATMPIYYERRPAKPPLDEAKRRNVWLAEHGTDVEEL